MDAGKCSVTIEAVWNPFYQTVGYAVDGRFHHELADATWDARTTLLARLKTTADVPPDLAEKRRCWARVLLIRQAHGGR